MFGTLPKSVADTGLICNRLVGSDLLNQRELNTRTIDDCGKED